MAPLSRDLVGLILPIDAFGLHLNGSGETIDDELEIRNFNQAAEVLSEVWSKTVIDKHPVKCVVRPAGHTMEDGSGDSGNYLSEIWIRDHI